MLNWLESANIFIHFFRVKPNFFANLCRVLNAVVAVFFAFFSIGDLDAGDSSVDFGCEMDEDVASTIEFDFSY